MPAKDFTADENNTNAGLVRCKPKLSEGYCNMNGEDDTSDDEYAVSITFLSQDLTARRNGEPATTACKSPADKDQHVDVVSGNRPSARLVAPPRQSSSHFKQKLSANCILLATVLAVLVLLDLHLLARLALAVATSRLGTSSGEAAVELDTYSHLADAPFCLPCSQVYVNDFEIEENRFKVNVTSDEQEGVTLCCSAQHDSLDLLVKEMYARVRYSSDRARGVAANETEDEDAAGEVFKINDFASARDQEFSSADGKVIVRLGPENSKDTSDRASLVVTKDKVAIQKRGHYYIYSQVPFTFSNQSLAMTQYVCRIRNGGGEDVLLENSVYPCDVTPKSCLHSFASGMFLLEKGDTVYLKISDKQCLDRTKPINFGVHHV